MSKAAPATRNAWTKPLAAPPGLASNPSNTNTSTSNTTNKQTHTNTANANVMRERFLHLQLSLVGQNVSLTLTDGSIVEGVLHTFTPFDNIALEHRNKYVIKAAKVVKGANVDGNGDEDNKEDDGVVGEGKTLILPAEKVSQLHVKSIRLEQNSRNANAGASDAFQTDTDISSGVDNVNDDLVSAGSAWTNPANSNNDKSKIKNQGGGNGRGGMFGGNVNSNVNVEQLGGKIGEWDQFSANEKQFGVKASFDENLYTTSLDKSAVDKKQKYQAERLAREIEGTTTTNMHLAEERGQAIEGDYDEEDRYSGVLVTGDNKKTKERTKMVLNPRTSSKKESQGSKDKAAAPAQAPAAATGTAAAAAPKKMNWAAMVAKSDAGKAPAKEGDTEKESNETKTNDAKETKSETKPKTTAATKAKPATTDAEKAPKKEEAPAAAAKKESPKAKPETDKQPAKPKSKLNAKAKSFSFNPSAKTFTPTFTAPAPAPAPAPVPQQVPVEPQMVMMQPQYMPYPPAGMYPPGAYPQMRYGQGAVPYGMMQQGGPGGAPSNPSQGAGQGQGQGPVPTANDDPQQGKADGSEATTAATDGEKEGSAQNSNASTPLPQDAYPEKGGEEGTSDYPAHAQGQVAPQQPGQPGAPMGYPGGPGYYPAGPGMPMGGRGPAHGQQHYHPQMGGPQQIQGVPRNYVFQVPPQHMQHQGNMPQYNQMYMQQQGGGGYPRPMEGDDMAYRGGGRGGRGGGRGRRGGRGGRGNGGRGKYNNYNNGQNQQRNSDGQDGAGGQDDQTGNNAKQ